MRLYYFTLGLLLLLGTSCASTVQPHSHIWIGNTSQNVWTYEKVTEINTNDQSVKIINNYFEGVLADGESLVLENDVKVLCKKDDLYVNGDKIPNAVRNIVIDKDGSIKHNAFIRTFK